MMRQINFGRLAPVAGLCIARNVYISSPILM